MAKYIFSRYPIWFFQPYSLGFVAFDNDLCVCSFKSNAVFLSELMHSAYEFFDYRKHFFKSISLKNV